MKITGRSWDRLTENWTIIGYFIPISRSERRAIPTCESFVSHMADDIQKGVALLSAVYFMLHCWLAYILPSRSMRTSTSRSR